MDRHNIVLGLVSGPMEAIEEWRQLAASRLIAGTMFPCDDGAVPNSNGRKALQVVTPKLRAALRWDETASWLMARCYALLNDRQEAVAWLEHAALDRGFINYPLLAEYDPALKHLRGDSRFENLMAQVKVRWERFEV